MEVIFTASAVMVNISVVSVFMVGVALDATVFDLSVILLFVRVSTHDFVA